MNMAKKGLVDDDYKVLEEENKSLRQKVQQSQQRSYEMESMMDKYEMEKSDYVKMIDEKDHKLKNLQQDLNSLMSENFRLKDDLENAQKDLTK